MATLYLVATPIGNREDITARALAVLRDVPLVAAEDTRRTRTLLQSFGISTPLVSYHAHNERSRRDELLVALTKGDLALVSDAGSPGLSDPGHDLVVAAIAAGHRIVPVPGASAVIAAVTASGLVPGPFLMLGFPPRKGEERGRALGRAVATDLPLVLFEAPNRLVTLLRDLALIGGERQAAVCRELTKLHEEIRRGPLSLLACHYEEEPPRGEIVVVVEPREPVTSCEQDAAEVLSGLLRAGLSPARAAREAALLTGLPRTELYALTQVLTASSSDAADGRTHV